MTQKQIINDYQRFTKWPNAQKIIVLRSVFSVLLCFSVKQFAGQERTATYANPLESFKPLILRGVAFGAWLEAGQLINGGGTEQNRSPKGYASDAQPSVRGMKPIHTPKCPQQY